MNVVIIALGQNSLHMLLSNARSIERTKKMLLEWVGFVLQRNKPTVNVFMPLHRRAQFFSSFHFLEQMFIA